MLGAGRARVLFNKDEVKHAGQKQQQQQSKKTHTKKNPACTLSGESHRPRRLYKVISDAQLDTRAALNAHVGVGCVCAVKLAVLYKAGLLVLITCYVKS